MLLNTKEKQTGLLEDWPSHYYETEDPAKREECLKTILAQEHTEADERLYELFQKRFDMSNEYPVDRFIRAWLFLQMYGRETPLFTSRKKIRKMLTEQADELCVTEGTPDAMLEEEWRDFARKYIGTCISSRNYRSFALGLIPMKDKTLAMKIAKEIDTTTTVIAEKAGLAEAFKPLRAVMIRTYIDSIQGGDEYWNAYTQTLK